MEREILYIIDGEYKDIQDYLKSKGYSASNIIDLKKYENGIMLNGVWAYMNQKPAVDDRLLVRVCENKKSENIVPVDIKLDIKYEDDDIIVINKLGDMPIHPRITFFAPMCMSLFLSPSACIVSISSHLSFLFDISSGTKGFGSKFLSSSSSSSSSSNSITR